MTVWSEAGGDAGSSRFLVAVESLALFVFGFVLMTFLYAAGPANPGDEIGAPGYDSFYHTKMAALLPEIGLVDTFPWLRFVYFRESGDGFVSHHYGFHVLLLPFVTASKWLTGDYLPGGRWAIAACLGANLLLFNLLLRAGRVRLRWLWLVLFVLMPEQFFTRHAFIRAIGPSLMFMQLLVLMLFQRRYIWAAIVLIGYVHLYLGAVLYGPVLVALYAVSCVFGPRGDRTWPWKMVLITAGGWLVGVFTYPYQAGMLEFLKMQVFGTGLSPEISVGSEWRPYSDPWWFASMAGTVFAAWSAALIVRLRNGPHLSARELALVLYNFAFLVLTLKARRFIEYWPPLALLSAAYMITPIMAGLEARFAGWIERARRATGGVSTVLLLILVAINVAILADWARGERAVTFVLAEWRAWALVLAVLLLGPLCAIWARRDADAPPGLPSLRLAAVPVLGALAVAGFCWWATDPLIESERAAPRLTFSPRWWILVALAYVALPPLVYALRAAPGRISLAAAVLRTGRGAVLATAVLGALVAFGSDHLRSIGKQNACYFRLPAIREALSFVAENSNPGDVVFTDDWDVFGVYFYYNSKNHYIVGLDPEFTHSRRPDLWERYVKVTRAQVPARSMVRLVSDDGTAHNEQISIGVEDIRDHFGATWVVVDRDHGDLASLLGRSPHLAELAFPCNDLRDCRDAPYLVFRVFKENRSAPASLVADAQVAEPGSVWLSTLTPVAAEQGWGTLQADASVEQRRLRIRGQSYERGLGTHAPSRLVYDVPDGCDVFEAVVGIDDETDGRGLVTVSVLLDGEPAYESRPLGGSSPAARVRVELRGARQITLRADTTEDGDRFDHVDWAQARFLRASSAGADSE